MKLGSFEISILSDGWFLLDGGQVFGTVPKPLWERKLPADSRNRVRMGLTCLLVKAGNLSILIETGIGDKFNAKFADIYGVDHRFTLLGELARRGLGPQDIDIVINTHLHFDHCGWNTCREGNDVVPTFPRARYVVQRGEWAHALSPTERDRASYISEFFLAVEPQAALLDGDQEIVPGIRVEVMPGHNRNLQCVFVESGGQSLCFVSDLVPTRAHLTYPWIMSFDLYPLETLENKKKLLPRLLRDRALVVFPHDPDVPCVRLTERDGKIESLPIAREGGIESEDRN
jgi:glyoxylase-like metal-dependent hydrolase (beta-lactamase superfamily II)